MCVHARMRARLGGSCQLVTWHRPPQRVSGWFPAELFVDISAATWRFGFMGLGLRTRVCFSQGPQVSAGPGLSLH